MCTQLDLYLLRVEVIVEPYGHFLLTATSVLPPIMWLDKKVWRKESEQFMYIWAVVLTEDIILSIIFRLL